MIQAVEKEVSHEQRTRRLNVVCDRLESTREGLPSFRALRGECSEEYLSYEQLIKTREWQSRRIEILTRDGFHCQRCDCDGLAGQNTVLQVHHKYYEWGKNPWQYPGDALETLCVPCHKAVHKESKIPVYKKKGVHQRTFTEMETREIIELRWCNRCDGAGWFSQWQHIEGGVCFRCRGSRFEKISVEIYRYIPKYLIRYV